MAKRDKPKTEKPKAESSAAPPILDAETKRIQRRVAKIRDKLRVALDDPQKRAQMVAAIRRMMAQDT